VKWEDVGGLEDVKKAILDTVQVLLPTPFFQMDTSCRITSDVMCSFQSSLLVCSAFSPF